MKSNQFSANLAVVFENSSFIVVDKPPEVLSVPSRLGAQDSRPVAGTLLQSQLGQPIFPIHRLDYEVSGLLMFAKSPEAHREANSWFEKRQIQKVYQALTEAKGDIVLNQDFVWTSHLVRGKKRTFEAPYGQLSITEARVIGKPSDYLDWRLKPVTGRSHQLRYELKKQGFPILGDHLYGSNFKWPTGIALRSIEIHFPKDGQKWSLPPKITAPLLDSVKSVL